MRQYLDIPEHHGIRARASYPLTPDILTHKNGVDEMNELTKDTVDQQQAGAVDQGWFDNEILNDATLLEGNLPTGHKSTMRVGLPTATWRKLNYGVAKGKSQTVDQQQAGAVDQGRFDNEILGDLSWMKEPVIVKLERVSTIPLTPDTLTTLVVDKMAADLKEKDKEYRRVREQIGRTVAEKNKLLYDGMMNTSIFGTSIWAKTATEVNRNMIDRDKTTNVDSLNVDGSLVNPAAADAFHEYFDRKIERENDERDAVYEAYLDKRDRGTAVCAAVVFDNTTGFTGMAHVDTLRGQL